MAPKGKGAVITAPENTELDAADVVGTIEDLQDLESVVESGLDSFMKVGGALAEISDRKLYKLEGFATFEDYARGKWNLDRSFAYKQIRASAVVKTLTEHFDVLPKNEAQARELTVLKEEDQQIEAWQRSLDKAEEKGQMLPTAAEVREAVTEIKKENQLAGGGDDEETAEDDPTKVYNRAVKSFPKIWSKLEDQFGLLEDLPIRAVSVTVETDEDAGIFEGDVEALVQRVNDWYETFTTDLEDYQEHRRQAKARIAAAKAGKAKSAGGANGRATAAVEAEAEETVEA